MASLYAHNHQIIKTCCRIFFPWFSRVALTKEMLYPLVARQIIFVNISNTILDHTPQKTETAPRVETTVNSLCFIRTNRDAVSCDGETQLDSQRFFTNQLVVSACEVLISCEAPGYVCDRALANPMLCCCLFVQTGNQHIYQPVGKTGNGLAFN